MHKSFLILVLILFPLVLFSQVKFEQEIRLKKSMTPYSAQKMIESLNFSKKVKWYKEIGINKISFEAKTKHLGKKYSIEFSKDGTFEDVEIEIKTKEVPIDLLEIMRDHFNKKYKKHKINKVQIQYSGAPTKVVSFLKNKSSITEIETRYELVLNAKVEKVFKKFEYLFSEEGEILTVAEIVEKNTDYIEY